MLGVEREKSSRDWVNKSYIGLGLLVLVAAVAAFVNKDPHRSAGLAGALGIVAIAWEYVLIGVIAAVIIFLLAQLDL